jgi:pimeloyl-ACP methyl ester carboxylesterase
MPYAEVNSQRLYYKDTGGDGPVVAFSHGFLMDSSMFAPQVAALKDRYRVITWDERGFGKTGDATGPFTYWDSADDLVALLGSLGIQRAVIGGMSQGGFIGLRAALSHPGIVRGLILIDTQAGVENPETLPYYQSLLERWLTQGMDDELGNIIATIILGQGWDGAARWIEYWDSLGGESLMIAFTTLAEREDIHDRLGEINVPALVVHGEQDLAIPLEKADALVAGLGGGAELTVIPGAGHASNMTHPEPVNAAIERFLASLP